MNPYHDLIAANVSLLEPIPTGMESVLPRLDGIRAVLFDIYGTLLISASGDIGPANKSSAKAGALEKAVSSAGFQLKTSPDVAALALHRQIEVATQRRSNEGVRFPEIEIREVWQQLLPEICHYPATTILSLQQLGRLALHFELLSNPVWPMPGLRGTLNRFREAGLPMGIISNAQFYTPPILEYFLGCRLDEAGFHPELQVTSFQLREGKPSQRLYQVMTSRLEALRLRPSDCLYVGNDMRNDIWPAAACGFRTVLFAGDARSLRLREGDADCAGVRPDAVVQRLADLERIMADHPLH